jgi:hypothetical protein
MIKFKPKNLCPNPASMYNLFLRGGAKPRKSMRITIDERV